MTRRNMCVAIAVAGMVTCGTAAGSPAPARDTGEASTVFRPYGTPGGLRQEFERLAARNPRITNLVTIGETHRGQEIVALKVTRRAAQLRDGRRPAILYIGGRHAREWITPEMVRRLAQRVLGGYGADRALTDLVDPVVPVPRAVEGAFRGLDGPGRRARSPA